MLEYLDASMAGSYWIPVERCKPQGDYNLFEITVYDDIAGSYEIKIVKRDRLRGVIPTGTLHKVKSWSHFYDAIASGLKTHELRHDDRNYQVGDKMLLQRFDNINGVYTGEECTVEITYITNRQKPCAFSGSVLQRDYCILSIRKI